MKVIIGILIPFFATSLGAAFVFFMRKSLSDMLQRALTGFAAGVMAGGIDLEPFDSGLLINLQRWGNGHLYRRLSDFGQESCFC